MISLIPKRCKICIFEKDNDYNLNLAIGSTESL